VHPAKKPRWKIWKIEKFDKNRQTEQSYHHSVFIEPGRVEYYPVTGDQMQTLETTNGQIAVFNRSGDQPGESQATAPPGDYSEDPPPYEYPNLEKEELEEKL